MTYIDFLLQNIHHVYIGIILICTASAIVGCFTFLRKRALLGDTIAHASLPGVCIGFIISGTKHPVYITLGAFSTGLLSAYLVDYIVNKSKLKSDVALGIVLSIGFSVGILLLTSIQHSNNAAQSGLDGFIFGKVASLLQSDVMIMAGIAIAVIVITILFMKEFVLISFDPSFAKSIGLPYEKIEFLLTAITVLTIVIGIQTIGVVLMAALLITPSAIARFWTDRLSKMIFIAIVASIFCGIMGAYLSSQIPNLPTGPSIVMFLSIVALLSFVFSPNKGIVYKYLLKAKNNQKILEENILKTIYQLGEANKRFDAYFTKKDILEKKIFQNFQLNKGLKQLKNKGYLIQSDESWKLSKEGKIKGQRITRLHRLWEIYLTQFLHLSPDHVHDDAETIEHLITPEIEDKLTELLGYPKVDPHQMEIPYKD